MNARHRALSALVVVVSCAAAFPAAAGGGDCLAHFERILDGIPASDTNGPLARPWLGGWEKARPQFGDADGDGDEDLFVFEDIGRLRLYRNDGPPGAPHFTFLTDDWTGLHDLYFGRVVDIDMDGDLDLFVQAPDFLTNIGGSDVLRPGAYVYTNVGTAASPVFQNLSLDPDGYLVSTTGEPIPMVTTSPDFVDLEGDGDQDLLFGDPTGAFYLYRNVGTPSSPAFQFETDHYDDLLVVFGSCGSSRTDPVPLSRFLDDSGLRHGFMLLSFFDLEGDGRPDLFLGDQFNSNVYYIRNQGGTPSPHFTCETQSYFPFPPQLLIEQNLVSAFTDLDGDSDPDVLVGSGTSSYTGLFQFRNDGPPSAPTFSVVSTNLLPELDAGRNSAPCFADLDGGGLLDLFVGAQGSEGQVFQQWNNVGSAQSPAYSLQNPPWAPVLQIGWAVPEFADLDADSDLDLFMGTSSGAVRWFRNDGTPTAPSFSEVTTDPAFGIPSTKRINARLEFNAIPRFLDDDGDGDLDLVAGSWRGAVPVDTRLVFFRNDGTRTAPDMVFVTSDWRGLGTVGQQPSPTFGDLDGDGDADLIVGRVDGTLACFVNVGTPAVPSFVPGPDPFDDLDIGGDPTLGGSIPFLVDLDGDGDTDLAVGELGGGVNLFRNVGAAAPAPPEPALLDPPPGGAIDGREPFRFDWASVTDPTNGQECTYELRIAGAPTDPPWTWRILAGLTQSEATLTLHEGDFRFRQNFVWTVVAHGCRPAPVPAWRAGIHSTWDHLHGEDPGTPDPVIRQPQRLAVAVQPVPSRADVTITVAIPEVGPARVEIFDASGRRVRTLWNGNAEVGERALMWNARDAAGVRVAPGIYFIRATLGAETATRRIVLVR